MHMLRKLLRFGKKEFYLELDEDSSVVEKVEAVATKVKEETKQVLKEAQQFVEESKPGVASTANQVKSEVKQFVKEVKPESTNETNNKKAATKTAIKSKKESAKNKNQEPPQKVAAKNKNQEPPQKVAPVSPTVDTSYSDEPFWVKLMYKNSEQQAAENKAEKTFATDYLISKPQSRRRPGGSLDKFKTMARETKGRS